MSLFPKYPGDQGAVAAAGTAATGKGTAYGTAASDVKSGTASASTAVMGTLTADVTGSSTAVVAHAQGLGRAAYLAGGVCAMFAEAIGEYNTGVEALNRRYEAAKAVDFNVSDSCEVDQTPQQRQAKHDSAVKAADTALKQQLQAEEVKLKATLDAAGDQGGGMLAKGPDDQETIVKLTAVGLIPLEGLSFVFPPVTVEQAKIAFKLGKAAYNVAKTPSRIIALKNLFLASSDVTKLLESLDTTKGTWAAVLDAIESSKYIDSGGKAALQAYLTSLSDIADAKAAVTGAESSYAAAEAASLKTVGRLSTFGKGLGVAGLALSAYSTYEMINHWDQLSTSEKVGQSVENGAGIAGGLATVAIIAGASGPAAPVVLVAAGVIAAGAAIYNNWDTISAGAEKAADWVGDRAEDIGEGAKELADKAGDLIDDITPW